MSSYRFLSGNVGVLAKPVDTDDAGLIDELYAKGLVLNYEGTLVFSMVVKAEIYDIGLQIGGRETSSQFIQRCVGAGVKIMTSPSTIKSYSELYYDGADPYHSTITLKQFYEKI